MKYITPYIAVFLVLAVFSCGNKEQKQENDLKAFQIDSISEGGVQRMQVSTSENQVDINGKIYLIKIQRTPGDSLSRVKNEFGDVFVDNEITLLITRDKGEKIFSKSFTKQSFSSLVDNDFLAKAILEGMVFDKIEGNNMLLAASVSFPQTDLYVPISINITTDGKMTMAKEEVMDDNYQEDSQNN